MMFYSIENYDQDYETWILVKISESLSGTYIPNVELLISLNRVLNIINFIE